MVIRPACLPHPPDPSLPIDPRSTSSYEGYLATIAGWGRTRSSRLSDQLTKVENVQVRRSSTSVSQKILKTSKD